MWNKFLLASHCNRYHWIILVVLLVHGINHRCFILNSSCATCRSTRPDWAKHPDCSNTASLWGGSYKQFLLEAFRFEHDKTTTGRELTRFFCVFSKNRDPESLILLFPPDKLTRVSDWRRLNPLPIANDKSFNFWRLVSLHYNIRKLKTPFTPVWTNFWTGKNLHGSAFPLHETYRTVQIFWSRKWVNLYVSV